mmetsp:Transcript_4852/g.17270  ORF Transcript_4852/g.17270 Transcript_4852/m.17270 type:complete len:437 (+) Transcript_4852:2993-4303(+)
MLQLLARLGANALQTLAALADDHALVGIALDDDAGADAAQFALVLPLVDDDGGGVGQLVAGQPEELFADDLAGQEALAAVGQRVFVVEPALLGQVGLEDLEQAGDVGLFLGRQRHELGEVAPLLHALEPGCEFGAAVHRVELVGDQHDRLVLGQQGQHLGVVQPKAARLDDKEHQVHIGQHAVDGAVEGAVQRGVVLGLETRRVDEDELGLVHGAHAGDAVTGGLGLVGRDADLLAHQRIEQRGLADIGQAHDAAFEAHGGAFRWGMGARPRPAPEAGILVGRCRPGRRPALARRRGQPPCLQSVHAKRGCVGARSRCGGQQPGAQPRRPGAERRHDRQRRAGPGRRRAHLCVERGLGGPADRAEDLGQPAGRCGLPGVRHGGLRRRRRPTAGRPPQLLGLAAGRARAGLHRRCGGAGRAAGNGAAVFAACASGGR